MTTTELDPIQRYAIDLVAGGAESAAEDDLNEDGALSDEDHEKAVDLAMAIIRGIRANPAAVLILSEAPTDPEQLREMASRDEAEAGR